MLFQSFSSDETCFLRYNLSYLFCIMLYISFRKPQRANDSLLEDNIIHHCRDRDLVRLTVLKASDFNSGDSENKINGYENPEMG